MATKTDYLKYLAGQLPPLVQEEGELVEQNESIWERHKYSRLPPHYEEEQPLAESDYDFSNQFCSPMIISFCPKMAGITKLQRTQLIPAVSTLESKSAHRCSTNFSRLKRLLQQDARQYLIFFPEIQRIGKILHQESNRYLEQSVILLEYLGKKFLLNPDPRFREKILQEFYLPGFNSRKVGCLKLAETLISRFNLQDPLDPYALLSRFFHKALQEYPLSAEGRKKAMNFAKKYLHRFGTTPRIAMLFAHYLYYKKEHKRGRINKTAFSRLYNTQANHLRYHSKKFRKHLRDQST